MRKALPLAGIAACCLLAADSTIDGPSLGYVNSRAGIRSVLGVVGASRISDPVTGELPNAQILPGSDSAIATNAEGALVRIRLSDGSLTGFGLDNVQNFAVSPSGSYLIARTPDRIHLLATANEDRIEYELPGSPLQLAVADGIAMAAVVVKEADSQALFLLKDGHSRRVFSAPQIAAVAFAPGSQDMVVADGEGNVFSFSRDLQYSQIGALPGLSALAVSSDGRGVAVAGSEIALMKLDGSGSTTLRCSCEAKSAIPLGGSRFMLTSADEGPMWILDASGEEARIAFVPGAAHE